MNIISYLPYVSPADPDLLVPRPLRKTFAERCLVQMPTLAPVQLSAPIPSGTFASDASMITYPSSLFSPSIPTYLSSSLTVAVVGPDKGLLASLSTQRYKASTSHAKVAGCIAATLLGSTGAVQTIYTDYLPVVRWIKGQQNPPSAYHAWLRSIINSRNQDVNVSHVKAHTNDMSLPSRLNRAVDFFASHAHSLAIPPPLFPIPTFAMGPFAFYSQRHGFIEGSINPHIIDHYSASFATSYKPWIHQLFVPALYNSNPPPS
ncbi:hypothetical protein H0H92_012695 [Tricholoma furcatifolium]|nr:hypothetical protein H0H92_012695 [Tricholoma furcatifolium]